MKKYKICPDCGEKNDPELIRCDACGADITFINATDDETEAKAAENVQSEETVSETVSELVRICSCGFANPAAARKCQKCGEYIADVMPSPLESEKNYALVLADGSLWPLTKPETVIGRDNDLSEKLCSNIYVSRSHCKIIVKDNKLYIQDMGSTNGTCVNCSKICDITELKNGDRVALAHVPSGEEFQQTAFYFEVKIS